MRYYLAASDRPLEAAWRVYIFSSRVARDLYLNAVRGSEGAALPISEADCVKYAARCSDIRHEYIEPEKPGEFWAIVESDIPGCIGTLEVSPPGMDYQRFEEN